MKSELILQLWNFHLSSIRPSFDRLTSENRRKRLTAETTSYGFNALHTAEAMVMMSRFILGVESNVPYSTYRASDEGRDIDPQQVRQLFEEGAEAIANAIRQTPDEAWDEPVQPPWGEVPRLQALMFLLHHNSYHVGQMVQTNKKGKEFAMESLDS